jgi:hypothetical protein
MIQIGSTIVTLVTIAGRIGNEFVEATEHPLRLLIIALGEYPLNPC